MRRIHSPVLQAVAVIVGTIIGAGVLGIPYAFVHGGFWLSAVVMMVVASMMAVLMLFLGEVALRTSGQHQLPGYAQQHLGSFAKHVLAAALIINIYGALLAYTVAQGEVVAALFGGSAGVWSVVFYLNFGCVIALGINVVKRIELLLTAAIFIFLFLIMGIAAPHVNVDHLFMTGSGISGVLTTYGVAAFACYGLTAVPQVHTILYGYSRQTIRRTLMVGSLLPPVLYVLFAAIVIGVSGSATTEVSTIGLGIALGPHMVWLTGLFAFMAISTSFLALGLALRNVFHRDYGLSASRAGFLALGVPLLLFAAGLRDFVTILSVLGAFSLSVVGVLGVLMFWTARTRNGAQDGHLLPRWFALLASCLIILTFAVSVVLLVVDLV